MLSSSEAVSKCQYFFETIKSYTNKHYVTLRIILGVTKPKEEICTENKPTQLGDGETSATEGETNARVVKLADIKLEQLTSESESGSRQLQQQKLGDTQTQAQGATVSTADNGKQ